MGAVNHSMGGVNNSVGGPNHSEGMCTVKVETLAWKGI